MVQKNNKNKGARGPKKGKNEHLIQNKSNNVKSSTQSQKKEKKEKVVQKTKKTKEHMVQKNKCQKGAPGPLPCLAIITFQRASST